MKITGKIKDIKGVQTFDKKDGTQGSKQGFLLTTDKKYNPDIYFEVLKQDVMAKLGDRSIGDIVEVEFNLYSREWNGKWFHSVNAWIIKSVNESTKETEEKKDDLPF